MLLIPAAGEDITIIYKSLMVIICQPPHYWMKEIIDAYELPCLLPLKPWLAMLDWSEFTWHQSIIIRESALCLFHYSLCRTNCCTSSRSLVYNVKCNISQIILLEVQEQRSWIHNISAIMQQVGHSPLSLSPVLLVCTVVLPTYQHTVQ